jgi:putative glutamine amidotransferase
VITGNGSPRLAVVDVTAQRPGQPEYHAKVQTLVGRIISDGQEGGWQVTRHAAADITTAGLLAATDGVDAIVIAGGEDIHPRFYGGRTGYPGETRHYPQADEGQIALVRRALADGTPLLGICRGLQVINVALGGTIVQHIEDDGMHRNTDVPIDDILSTHAVVLEASSTLADSLGEMDILVQSAHHQGVGSLGTGLNPAASAPDGLVEALEHATAPVTGVQWHPEAPLAPAHQLPLLLRSLSRQLAGIRIAA